MKRMLRAVWTLAAAALLLAGLPGGALADDANLGPVTYADVGPIFQQNCQQCHRPGDIGPFSLRNYEEARPWAKSIKEAVATRTMPPWDANPEVGHWANDVSLTQDEIDTVVAWVDQGARMGNPADLPEPVTYGEGGWRLGEPDLVFRPDTPYTVSGDTEDEYRCYIIETGLTEDAWMVGQEQDVDNPAVVHHIMSYLDPTHKFRERDAADPKPGFECGMGAGAELGLQNLFGGWAPGNAPGMYDPGVGRRIPAGADIVYQVHYHNTTGEDQVDNSGMGVHLAREPIQQEARIMLSGAFNLDIPAGEPNAVHTGRWRTPKDITVTGLMPHMHYIGKAMKATAIYPDGRSELLLDVPNYDFNWQITYEPAEPVKLPKGTAIEMVSVHDNSADNPFNPYDPPVDMAWGEATNEEMAHVWILFTFDDEQLNIEPTPVEQVLASRKFTKDAGEKLSARAD